MAGEGRGFRWGRVLVLATATVVALLLVAVLAFLGWALTPYRAEAEPLARAEGDPAVEVSRGEDSVVLTPTAEPSGTGIVFYPGARVEPDAYVASWAPVVAATGVTVVVPHVRLHLALLDQARAESAVREAPDVDTWYLGGHSMGGAFAAQHLGGGDSDTDWTGLVLWASYAVDSAELAAREDLRVLSVAGGRDEVLPPAEIEERRSALPADALMVTIEDMNHAQFGAYGEQSGDGEPQASTAEAHEELAAVTTDFLVP
ncbi:alpha/beta hydrolase [Nocardiopsis sp. MG754419]|uniref:alpha/beta hydrolase n=1 Tax=Nocardiopsis sp. MG754419 TaxID=2259865 RepID=UPI001BA4864D|nr:alpha/beta hydrolase [Nocardiopsis sp. MG754419]MBR8741764.1 alpha/beta hydrolase [Nocardiopsis sp. MG754419]